MVKRRGVEPGSYGGLNVVARAMDLIAAGRGVDSGLQALEYVATVRPTLARFRHVLWAGTCRPPCAVPHSARRLHWTHRPLTTAQWQGVMSRQEPGAFTRDRW